MSVSASCKQKAQVRTEPDHLLERVLRVQVWLHFSQTSHRNVSRLILHIWHISRRCSTILSTFVSFPSSSPGNTLLHTVPYYTDDTHFYWRIKKYISFISPILVLNAALLVSEVTDGECKLLNLNAEKHVTCLIRGLYLGTRFVFFTAFFVFNLCADIVPLKSCLCVETLQTRHLWQHHPNVLRTEQDKNRQCFSPQRSGSLSLQIHTKVITDVTECLWLQICDHTRS